MHVVYGIEHLDESVDPVFVVVGVFDGLHLGHAYLLRHLVAEARRRHARPVVITFDHHPDEVLVGNAPPLLCDPDERLARLADAGVDTTVVVHFDQQMRETTYDAFVSLIESRVPVAGFLMTPDAAFGYKRAGTPEALAALGRDQGFEVVVVAPYDIEGRHVRSSEVRAVIAAGDLDAAAGLLGRAHTVVGEAAPAAGGSVLRFGLPVALPPDGAYVVRVDDATRAGLGGAAAETRVAIVDADSVKVDGPAMTGRRRISFLERAGAGEH